MKKILSTIMVIALAMTGFCFAEAPAADILAELDGVLFELTSGAGGWGTELTMGENGTFTGNFHDSEMGDMADEYPNGTVYSCNFSGQFSVLNCIDENTYTLKIDHLDTESASEQIDDGIRYINGAEPYGFNGTEEFMLYMPGTACDALPKGAEFWVNIYMMAEEAKDSIPFYCLYNPAEELAFAGYSDFPVYDDEAPADDMSFEETMNMRCGKGRCQRRGKTADQAALITAIGTAAVSVPADTATISIGVSKTERDAISAQAAVNEVIAEIRKVLTENGLSNSDINTDYINMYPNIDYSSFNEVVNGYSATTTLSVRVNDIENAGRYVDLALSAGATTLNSISFSCADTAEAKNEALKHAVEAARTKAEVIAEASGLQIISIESVTEEGDDYYSNYAEFAIAESAAKGTEVQSAGIAVGAKVAVVFRCIG